MRAGLSLLADIAKGLWPGSPDVGETPQCLWGSLCAVGGGLAEGWPGGEGTLWQVRGAGDLPALGACVHREDSLLVCRLRKEGSWPVSHPPCKALPGDPLERTGRALAFGAARAWPQVSRPRRPAELPGNA